MYITSGSGEYYNDRLIGARIWLAQISARADRGKPKALLLAEVSRSRAGRKSRGILLSAVGSRKRDHFTSHIENPRLYVIL